MTEEEAKKRWCPFARNAATGEADSVFNRYIENGKHHAASEAPCIGSFCMAWRWMARPERREVWEPTTTAKSWEEIPGIGFCGLAGTPS